MMRRRFGVDNRKSIFSDRYKKKQILRDDFRGVAELLYLEDTSVSTAWGVEKKKMESCMEGTKWLQIMPEEKRYIINVVMTPENTIDYFYIAVIAGGVDGEDDMDHLKDFHLDIVVHSKQRWVVNNREKFEDAYVNGDMTRAQFECAIETCSNLYKKISCAYDDFVGFCQSCFEEVESESEYISVSKKIS